MADLSNDLIYFKFIRDKFDNNDGFKSFNEFLNTLLLRVDELSDDRLRCIYLIHHFHLLEKYFSFKANRTIVKDILFDKKDRFYMCYTRYQSLDGTIRLYVYKSLCGFKSLQIHYLHLNKKMMTVDKYMNNNLYNIDYLNKLYAHMDKFYQVSACD